MRARARVNIYFSRPLNENRDCYRFVTGARITLTDKAARSVQHCMHVITVITSNWSAETAIAAPSVCSKPITVLFTVFLERVRSAEISSFPISYRNQRWH